jgi:putative hydrolase
MDPAEALDRIVYLLDRVLTESFRVKAYKGAADTVRATPPDELRRLHAEGRLTDLPGIGPKTASIIGEALDGNEPAYIAELAAKTELATTSDEGAALRAALRGDCHVHSTWSDGGAPIDTMARAAQALGHEYIVMTDHSPRLTIAHGLNRERLLAQLDEIERLNEELDPFRILTGIEVDILEDGTLDQDEDMLERLDLVVGSVHSKLKMPGLEMTRRMVLAVSSPHVDILGHCTGRQVPGHLRQVGQSDFAGRVPSQFDPEIVFAACKQFDTALEINCRPERQDPPDELLELALDWDLRLSIDTDAHAPGQLEWQVFGCDKAAGHGVEPDQVVNAMSADDLLAWTGSH